MCQHKSSSYPHNKKGSKQQEEKIDNFDKIIKLSILGNKNSNSKWLTITEEHRGWHPFKQKQYAQTQRVQKSS